MKLDEALDAVQGSGSVQIERRGGSATVEVEDVDRLGVRVRRVRVDRDRDWDIADTARRLPQTLRSLPEPVVPQEVSPQLGGAILRTDPERYDGERYFEVEVGRRSAEVRRVRVSEGERASEDWTLTREQLGRLLDELED